MPSISDIPERHTILDRRPDHYLCFPDICRTPSGRLLVVYNDNDAHVCERRFLMQVHSDDSGGTWSSPRILRSKKSHCPRLSLLRGNYILLTQDSGNEFMWSSDEGNTWTETHKQNFQHGLIDRVMELDANTLLTTAHAHRGKYAHPATRQPTTEQMTYISEDSGHSWNPLSVMAFDRNLVLCEASMCHMPDGRILAMLRENCMVYEPMYLCESLDNGKTWSAPRPTPLIGHRPTLGLTPNGKLLATYRNVGPAKGTSAWLGTKAELTDFQVHGYTPGNPQLTADGLHVKSDEGPDQVVRYALRPMTDPRSATASLEAVVQVNHADTNSVALRLGMWWSIMEDHIRPELDKSDPIPIPKGQPNTIRIDYESGRCALFVNGEKKTELEVPADSADTRPIMFGAPYPFESNSVDCIWKEVSLHISEPAYLRTYDWRWDAKCGHPDAWTRANELMLKADQNASPADFGYSGWTTLEDGSFLCVYHHGGGDAPDYRHGYSSHVMATRFSAEDFK